MEKIIVAIDGLNYKSSVTEFAISTAIRVHGHLVGIFLHDRNYHSYRIYNIDTGRLMSTRDIEKREADDMQLRKEAIEQFKKNCTLHKIQHTVREDKNTALKELIHESLYADLLIIYSGEQFNHLPTFPPSPFIRDLLEAVQCPVILAPDDPHPIKKAVLLYDGSPASVYAIKCFCNQVPMYTPVPVAVELLAVKKNGESLHLKENKLIKEYLKRHFPKATFRVIGGDAPSKIPAILKKEDPGTLIVLGAYQRGAFSRWFRPSMADVLLSTLSHPLFIAHTR